MTRSSSRSTQNESSSERTPVRLGGVFIPSSLYVSTPRFVDRDQFLKILSGPAEIVRYRNVREQPKLRVGPALRNMNVTGSRGSPSLEKK
jgi:hypothetical protein